MEMGEEIHKEQGYKERNPDKLENEKEKKPWNHGKWGIEQKKEAMYLVEI